MSFSITPSLLHHKQEALKNFINFAYSFINFMYFALTHLRRYGATVVVAGKKGLINGQVLEEVTLFIQAKVGQHCFVLSCTGFLEL